jgi:hypothetical protein
MKKLILGKVKQLKSPLDIKQLTKSANEQYADWLIANTTHCNFDLATTLTFERQPKNIDDAEEKFRQFLHRLNRHCYKTKYTRFKSAHISIVTTIEGSISGKNLHYHCAIQIPKDYVTENEFKALIKKDWNEVSDSKWQHIHFEDYIDKGWINYMCKEIKDKNTLAISKHCYW